MLWCASVGWYAFSDMGNKKNGIITDPDAINKILRRGVAVDALPSWGALYGVLTSGKRLRIYTGADPTADTLHLSHAKNFMLLEELRGLGHEVILLVGDFTARIGDPTGRGEARKQLTQKEVKENVKKWLLQIRPLMKFDDKKNTPKVLYNSAWLSRLSFQEVLSLASNFTVQQMLERDMFWRRFYGEWRCKKCNYPNAFEQNLLDRTAQSQECQKCHQKFLKNDIVSSGDGGNKRPIYLHEFLYPLMQGYDSVAMDVDIELCGSDQTFNALAGRTLLKRLKNKGKFVVAVNLMANPKTGELMAKSRGTGVFLSSPPNEMYGEIMAEPDEMIEPLFINCTRLPLADKEKIMSLGPRAAKARVTLEIVKKIYGAPAAQAAEKTFDQTFRAGGVPEDILEINLSPAADIVAALIVAGVIDSRSEWRRLIAEGAVRDETNQKITDPHFSPTTASVLKIGKHRFVKLSVK